MYTGSGTVGLLRLAGDGLSSALDTAGINLQSIRKGFRYEQGKDALVDVDVATCRRGHVRNFDIR